MEKNEAAVALGKTGGKKRWADKSEKERKEHTKLMGIKSGESRRNNKNKAKIKDEKTIH